MELLKKYDEEFEKMLRERYARDLFATWGDRANALILRIQIKSEAERILSDTEYKLIIDKQRGLKRVEQRCSPV